jgi:hypothetical protein
VGSDLPLRHPGQAQALTLTFASSKEDWIVAPCIAASADGKVWIERKSRLHRGSRLVELPDQRESRSEG